MSVSAPVELQQPVQVMHASSVVASGGEIDLLDLWRLLMRGKWWILFTTFLGTAVAVFIALTTIPIYKADLLLEAVTTDGKKGGGALAQLGGLAAMAGINLGSSGDSKDAALARLQSRAFIEEFIRTEKLMPVLFENKWDPATQKWKEPDPAKQPTMLQGVEYFQRDILKITEDRKTGLITLSIEWQNREQTSLWANLLVERINDYLRSLAVQEATKNMDYLQRELTKTQIAEIRGVIANVLEDQIKKIMLVNVGKEYAFKVLDPAVAPERPIKPKKRVIVGIGLVVGLFLGILVVIMGNFSRQVRARSRPPVAPLSAKPAISTPSKGGL